MRHVIFNVILLSSFCISAVAQINEPPCPNIRFSGMELFDKVDKDGTLLTGVGKTISLTVETGKEIENYKVNYQWTLMGGTILSGQNTKTITFVRDDYGLNVTIEVQGLPTNCNNRDSLSLIMHRLSEMLDEYEKLTPSEEKQRLDDFFSYLRKNFTMSGLIKLGDGKDLKRLLKFLDEYVESKWGRRIE